MKADFRKEVGLLHFPTPMYQVYVIQNPQGRFYIGMSEDPEMPPILFVPVPPQLLPSIS